MNLVSSSIPALDGVGAELTAGARVADVGCGHGSSSLLPGRAFPASEVVGFDYHAASVDLARTRAVEAGLADRVEEDLNPVGRLYHGASTVICVPHSLSAEPGPPSARRRARRG